MMKQLKASGHSLEEVLDSPTAKSSLAVEALKSKPEEMRAWLDQALDQLPELYKSLAAEGSHMADSKQGVPKPAR